MSIAGIAAPNLSRANWRLTKQPQPQHAHLPHPLAQVVLSLDSHFGNFAFQRINALGVRRLAVRFPENLSGRI